MKNFIVLGIGNKLLMDDGIGVYVVEELRKQDLTAGITYIVGETDIDYCLEKINAEDYLIIIDAARLGKPAGHITVLKLEDAVYCKDIGLTMHNLHLLDMLKLSGKTKGLMIGIEPHMIDYYYGLSATLGNRLKELAAEAFDIIKHYFF